MKHMEEYRKEFSESLERVRIKIEHKRKPKLNPYTISAEILQLIHSYKINENEPKTLVSISDRIRKFHDFYGWMSKGEPRNIGQCSGTFFRSADYISINPKARSGKKLDRNSDFGIHVEHSIPVKTLRNMLIKNTDESSQPEDIFDLLITYSICTGFSRLNEKTNIIDGFSSIHPDFNEDGTAPEPINVKPFVRYNGEIEIFSMFTGEKVALSENLEQLNALTKTTEIFKWAFLKKHYDSN